MAAVNKIHARYRCVLQVAKDRPNFFHLVSTAPNAKWGFGKEMEKREKKKKLWVVETANMLRAVPAFALPRIYCVIYIPFAFYLMFVYNYYKL